MSKFNTTTRKLRKLWEQTQKNQSDLSNIDNADELTFFTELSKQQNFKNIIELHNSDFFITNNVPTKDASFIILDNDNNSLTTTVNKNTKLPIAYEYNHTLELDIPEQLIPFIKVVPEVKSMPNNELVLGGLFTSSRFGLSNDIIQIRGDGSILYKGNPQLINNSVPRVNTLLSVFTSKELTDVQIPVNNTKKVFKATIEYTNISSGDKFRITGNITGLDVRFDVGTGCDSNTNRDIYEALVYQEGGQGERGDNEFLGLTATTFSIKARETQIRWVDIPPCTQQSTVNNGITKSASFSSTSSYQFQIVGKHENLTDETFLGNNQIVAINTLFNTINSQTFEDIGQRAYYSSSLEGVLSVNETGSSDGNFFDELQLDSSNLPNTSKGHILPYIQISFQRNFQTFDRKIFETDEFIQHTIQPIKTYLKKNNGKFFISLIGTFLFVSPASEIAPNSRQFPKYNDFYGIFGGTYTISSENHSFLDTPVYISQLIDTQIRLRIFLQNTLYWREERKYGI